MSPRGRFFTVFAVSVLVLLGLAVLDATHRVAAVAPIDQFRGSFWLLAWLPFFFDHLSIVVAVTAVVTFSLVIDPYDLGGTGRLMPAIRSVLIGILIVGLVNGLWFGLFGPSVHMRLDRIAYRSDVARSARERADTYEAQARYEAALAELRLYRSVVGTSTELERSIERLEIAAGQARRDAREASLTSLPERVPRAFEVEGLSVPDLVSRARDALSDGQFYTAHYYASVAARQSTFRRDDALQIQAEALNAIEDGIRRRQEAGQQSLFQDKLAAYQLMQRGESDPRALVEAYYRFEDLANRAPDDPDVIRYRRLTQERLKAVTFFVDEAVQAQALPGRRNVAFFNPRLADRRELVIVGSVVTAPAGDFFYDVEILRWPKRGTEGGVTHLRVPYGKRIGDMLALRSIQRSGGPEHTEQYVIDPEYLEGQPDDTTLGELVPLQLDMDEIMLVAGGVPALNTLSLVDLVRAPAALANAGESVAPAGSELIERIVRIIGYFVLAFYAISLGWRYRSLYLGRPPLPILLLVPVLPWAIWWTVSLVRVVLDVLIRTVAPSGSAGATIPLVSAVMLIALLVAITSLARQTIEP